MRQLLEEQPGPISVSNAAAGVDALVEASKGQKMLLLNFIEAIPAAVASVRCR